MNKALLRYMGTKRHFFSVAGLGLFLLGAFADFIGLGNPGSGLGSSQWLMMVLGVGVFVVGMLGRRAIGRGFLVILVCGGTYLSFELVVSSHARWIKKTPPGSIVVFDQAANGIRFDPVSGYRLPEEVVRYTRIINGKREFQVSFQGNTDGFPDSTEFTLEKNKKHRFLVLGDSFSAQYVDRVWSMEAEELLEKEGHSVELMNASLAAVGVANWWSILNHEIKTKNYELDGVIFPAYGYNLERKFFVRDCGEGSCQAAYWPSWDPSTYPKNLSEARKHLQPEPYHIVSNDKFNGLVQGDFLDLFPFKFIVADRVSNLFRLLAPAKSKRGTASEAFSEGQLQLFGEIKQILSQKGLPAFVFHINGREEFNSKQSFQAQRLRNFADIIGANYIDSGRMYGGMEVAEVGSHFYPFDGHWNQKGSDLFANFVSQFLSSYISEVPAS